jgi:2-phospho-L-lactate/phosphoenolpyruvate guanylyltransferase
MILHAVVPVKDLPHAKSRLHPALAPDQRQSLVRDMLMRVIRTLQACRIAPCAANSHAPCAEVAVPAATLAPATLSEIWVVSRDPEVLDLAAHLGARPLNETGFTLNSALEQARHAARAAGADALLVIPADVPLITCNDIGMLAGALADGADLVIAPDEVEQGTNALGVWLSADLRFRFGPNSFRLHSADAAWNELIVTVCRSPTLALDVDTPTGLARFRTAS